VLIYAPAVVAVLRLPKAPVAGGAAPPPVLASIAEGFAFLRREPRLIGALLVTLLFNLFGWPFTSMIPVIGVYAGPEEGHVRVHVWLGEGAAVVGEAAAVMAALRGWSLYFPRRRPRIHW